MKIGKITIDGYYNYGNLLQSYALQEVLLNYSNCVDTIWHMENNFLPEIYKKWGWKEYIKWFIDRYGFKTNILNGHMGREIVRQGKFKDWADRYISIRKGVHGLETISNDYDYFITGSDQVWNPLFHSKKQLKDHFLQFAPSAKRLSYAASISCPAIPSETKELFVEGINGIREISVREEAGAELIQQMTGRKAEVHVDPTMLLSADKWREVNRVPAWYHGEEYILTYFLGKRPTKVLERLQEKVGIQVVNLLDENVYEHYVTGVDEFIWAVEHAKLMYTDSFHGTVFSILFHTPFVVCNRKGSEIVEKMGSRIDTLLGNFGLTNRRASASTHYEIKNPFEELDWSKADTVLEKERKRSDLYFQRIFNR